MKRFSILFIMALICNLVSAQTAKSVLDKTASTISNRGGVSANFQIVNEQYGTTNGTISVKGRKFCASTPQMTVWFDGKTQWAYMKNNNEVNVSNPTESELQAINPYNFINIYKNGFSYDMKTVGKEYQVHLKATNKSRKIQEMYIHVNKSTYVPSKIRMRQGAKWNTITISNFKASNLSDGLFRFDAKAYPDAEVIDLR